MARSRTSTRVRTITSDELHTFTASGGAPGGAGALAAHLAERVRTGYTRPEWCFMAERGRRVAGRVAFWARPTSPAPREFFIDPVLLRLPWRGAYLVVGGRLLRHALWRLRRAGATRAEVGVDTPSDFDPDTGRRLGRLLRREGRALTRETLRFRLLLRRADGDSTHGGDGAGPTSQRRGEHDRLTYRSLEEVGEHAFTDAGRVVTDGTLDPRMRWAADRQGAEAHARRRFEQALARVRGGGWRADEGWWQVAYAGGAFVGLVMPAVMGGGDGTIDYIGVAPDQRGRHHSDDLLRRAASAFAAAGGRRVVADTDVANWAMAAAFRRAGWEQFAASASYAVDLAGPPGGPPGGPR